MQINGELLPAETLLSRAEVLYSELTGLTQQALADAIVHYPLMLEARDPKLIELARQRLPALVDNLRR